MIPTVSDGLVSASNLEVVFVVEGTDRGICKENGSEREDAAQ